MDAAIVPVSPITPIVNAEPPSSEMQPNKRRRKKSAVWDYFTVETVGDGCIRACCNQCKKSFAYITGSKLAGTSHLKRHIALAICPVIRQKNEQTPGLITRSATGQPKKRYRNASTPFDQEHCTHEMAKMIIMHEYPLHIVEHQGFSEFVKTLQPQFNMVSFNTIQQDCVAMFLGEKQNLLNFISGISGRVSLTLDLWTSNQTVGHVFLTGHFIDTEWNLHRRILNVIRVPYPDSDGAINQAVVSCLTDWNLENRLLTLTLDESFANETLNGNLRGFFSVKNPLMLNGQLLIGNCYARVISHLAQEALGAMGETVQKIRESVKYVKTSDVCEDKFLEVKQQLQVPSTKDLFIDDQTKWNTTYHMLVAAGELKEVFACLETADPDYRIAPGMDDWKRMEILCSFLKLFFDAANILTSPTYPTANLFYHEVSKLQLDLTHAALSRDPFISNLIKPLKEKFDRYWNDCWLVVAIAVVLDPRFKMKLVEFSFSRIYDDDAGMWVKMVDDGIHELFSEYVSELLPPPETFVEEGNDGDVPKNEMPGKGTIREKDTPQEGSPQVAPTQDESLQVAPQEGSFQGSSEEASLQGPPHDGSFQGPLQDASLQGPPHDGSFQGTMQDASLQGPLQDGSFEAPPQEVASQDPLISIGDGLSDFEVYISEFGGSQQMKSELDQYLEESLLPRLADFDILGWWKLNEIKYPTLSRMASDILSIPFSVAAPDSVFDTDRKQMDSYRSSLHPVTVEALICSKDWLQYGASSAPEFGNGIVKMEY
ncbi:hypothetical protein SLE2022_381560 [Rubroshorea leprosula]